MLLLRYLVRYLARPLSGTRVLRVLPLAFGVYIFFYIGGACWGWGGWGCT